LNKQEVKMKRYVLILIFLSVILYSALYKPYPIIFVHGTGSNSSTWGGGVYWMGGQRTDSLNQDSIPENSTYGVFENYMKPYAWAWYEWEKEQYPNEIPTYTPDTTVEEPSVKARYPNKIFLEVVNMDDLFDNGIHSGRINL